MAHIGDVIENGLGWDRDIWSIPGREIRDFGDRVREWAHSVSPVNDVAPDAAYYGGWPSANLPTIGWGGVVSTALLLEDHVIGKDPISDWFCLERYSRPNLMASRKGWQPQGWDSPPDVEATRRFLAVQLPAIHALLPLLDAGIVTLVPSEVIRDANRLEVEGLAHDIGSAVLEDPPLLARQFKPEELAVDDDVRGTFVLTGGEVENQTRKHLQRAVDYFAAEYVLSQKMQATYTSVFEWESHLLRRGVSEALSPVVPTAQVMLSSHIPALSGLTPEVIRTVHDDDAFGAFRADLVSIYGNCPLASRAEIDAYVRDREKTLLEPRLAHLAKEMDRGPLARLGISAGTISFSLTACLMAAGATAVTTGSAAAAPIGLLPILGSLVDATRRRPKGPIKIWSTLVKHGGTIQDEIPRAVGQAGNPVSSPSTNPWGIEPEPGMYVTVASGTILHWNSDRSGDSVAGGQYHQGVYAPCTCGSTLKYRFCCAGVTPVP